MNTVAFFIGILIGCIFMLSLFLYCKKPKKIYDEKSKQVGIKLFCVVVYTVFNITVWVTYILACVAIDYYLNDRSLINGFLESMLLFGIIILINFAYRYITGKEYNKILSTGDKNSIFLFSALLFAILFYYKFETEARVYITSIIIVVLMGFFVPIDVLYGEYPIIRKDKDGTSAVEKIIKQFSIRSILGFIFTSGVIILVSYFLYLLFAEIIISGILGFCVGVFLFAFIVFLISKMKNIRNDGRKK